MASVVVCLQGEDVAPVGLCLLRASIAVPLPITRWVRQLLVAGTPIVLQWASGVGHALLLDHGDVARDLQGAGGQPSGKLHDQMPVACFVTDSGDAGLPSLGIIVFCCASMVLSTSAGPDANE